MRSDRVALQELMWTHLFRRTFKQSSVIVSTIVTAVNNPGTPPKSAAMWRPLNAAFTRTSAVVLLEPISLSDNESLRVLFERLGLALLLRSEPAGTFSLFFRPKLGNARRMSERVACRCGPRMAGRLDAVHWSWKVPTLPHVKLCIAVFLCGEFVERKGVL